MNIAKFIIGSSRAACCSSARLEMPFFPFLFAGTRTVKA
jgi:hypothetical protein